MGLAVGILILRPGLLRDPSPQTHVFSHSGLLLRQGPFLESPSSPGLPGRDPIQARGSSALQAVGASLVTRTVPPGSACKSGWMVLTYFLVVSYSRPEPPRWMRLEVAATRVLYSGRGQIGSSVSAP